MTDKQLIALGITAIVLQIVFYGAIVYVAMHFIIKFWQAPTPSGAGD